MRPVLLFAILVLFGSSLPGSAEGKKLEAVSEIGLIQVVLKGKLVRRDRQFCVQARNPGISDEFWVELLRTEDKNQKLDEHLHSLLGQVVSVRGFLRFIAQRIDGPELGIPIRNASQVRKVLTK